MERLVLTGKGDHGVLAGLFRAEGKNQRMERDGVFGFCFLGFCFLGFCFWVLVFIFCFYWRGSGV